ncbi:MAG: ATPase, T2SS/T4P/T4SS family, partial [Patescibacteria group bacterium]
MTEPKSTGVAEFDLNRLLDLAIEKKASDVHIGAGAKIALRIFGEIHFVESFKIPSEAEAEQLIFKILKGKKEIAELQKNREFDFSYRHTDQTNFRCNAFYRCGKIALVMRQVNKTLPTLDELGLPAAARELIQKKQGLILVCGPTGSGKSTTLRSMLEEVNET